MIHSFPTMYILGGVDVVEMGQIKVFVQELGLKQWFLADINRLSHFRVAWDAKF